MNKQKPAFPAVEKDQWWETIRKELRGKPEEMLFTQWFEGLETPPFHSWEDERPDAALFPAYSWHASERIGPERMQAQALDALNRGADGLLVETNPSTHLSDGLKNVQLEFLRLAISPEKPEGPWKEQWTALLSERNQVGRKLNTALNYDPFARMAEKGRLETNVKDEIRSVEHSREIGLFRHAFFVDTHPYQISGARIDTQLGIALATAYEWMQQGAEAKTDDFHFSFAQGREYLLEIAKLRAFRELWPYFLNEIGLKPSKDVAFVSACSSDRHFSASDPHGNLLRLTTMAMSSILGGAQNVMLSQHHLKKTHRKEHHLPLNILHLLRFEGRLDKLNDPLAGSYSIESLTQQIAELGWKAFQSIEAEGGLLHSLEEGRLQARIAEEAKKEQQAFDSGERPVIGSNLYPYFLSESSDENNTASALEDIGLNRLAANAEKENLPS